MAVRTYGKEFGIQTRAVHSGNDIDKDTKAVKRPITMANSYELPYDPSDINWSGAGQNLYTRNGGANQRYLEEKIASFEGADDCIVLASGAGALSGLFFSLLKSGDHVIFSSVTYIAVYRLLNELFNNKFNVETSIVDTSDTQAIKAALKPNTRLIHIETPANPTLSVSDIKSIAEIAHKNNALLSVDNTVASPYNQRPLDLGADFSVESLTKYINGHGDAMGGSISARKEYLDIIRKEAQINLGATISPFNAWLIMRGASTFPLRMKQHNENALTVAQFLDKRAGISFVSYPGLKKHKDNKTALLQMNPGFGGLLSFALKASGSAHNEFVSKLRVITSAVSLGHDTSLIAYIGENDERRRLYPQEFRNGFLRLSAGIEDAQDIVQDIEQALKKTGL